MRVIVSAQETSQQVDEARLRFRRIAFVPTMGALHEGHRSLIRRASEGAPSSRATRPFTVVSIFVNPTQFNSKEDLEKYPRTLKADLKLCEKEGVDLVFTPTANEIYPEGPAPDVPVPAVGRPMEGEFRPGHFAGVCAVVKRLFAIVRPDVALFGEKDFQQVRVIEEMVKEQKIPVEIVRCPTVRDENGLALSSRNRRLSPEGYQKALGIPRAILSTSPSPPPYKGGGRREVSSLIETAREQLGNLEIDYLTIADSDTLEPLKTLNDRARLFIAAWVEGVRLIDNDCL